MTLQAVVVSFSPNAMLTERLWTILVDNGVKWANDGWGGLANSRTAVYITPTLSKDDAASSMAPLIQFGQELVDMQVEGAQLRVTTFPSFGTFFNFFANSEVAVGTLLRCCCEPRCADLYSAGGRKQPCTRLTPHPAELVC
jgi:hypothetical protein